MIKMQSIVFICEKNSSSPSTEHRCIMITEELVKRGYVCNIFYGKFFLGLISNYLSNLSNWIKIIKKNPDIIIIQRTSNFIDYYMVKFFVNNSKIIFDYDDALFHVTFLGRLMSYSHLNKLLTNSNYIFAGSHYLMDYSQRLNHNVSLIPSPVYTDFFNINKDVRVHHKEIVIGWLGGGTKYQLRYLNLLKKPLIHLSHKYEIKFKIVSALAEEVRDEFKNLGCSVDFGLDHWVPLKETPKLVSDFDIGVMPLLDEPFARGKCAMKILEYMAMGIPVVASPVGENKYVIINSYNGFLAANDNEWIEYLEKLIINESLRNTMGQNGQKFVMDNYSVAAITNKIESILKEFDPPKYP